MSWCSRRARVQMEIIGCVFEVLLLVLFSQMPPSKIFFSVLDGG